MKTQDDMFWTLWEALNCRCSFPRHVASHLFTIFDNRRAIVWVFDESYAFFSPNLLKYSTHYQYCTTCLLKNHVFHIVLIYLLLHFISVVYRITNAKLLSYLIHELSSHKKLGSLKVIAFRWLKHWDLIIKTL